MPVASVRASTPTERRAVLHATLQILYPRLFHFRWRIERLAAHIAAANAGLIHKERQKTGATVLRGFGADGEAFAVLGERDVKAIAR